MNPIRPLLFLTFRSVANGLKRALTTPRRLITLIAFIGYYFFLFIRPALMSSATMPVGATPRWQLDFPPLAAIDSFVFAIFSVLSLFLLLGALNANTTFKPADVDVLFSTPISPKVILTFRMVRDYLATLLLPLLMAVLGLRPAKMGWEAFFRNMPNPQYSSMVLRFMVISWLLMSLSWIMLTYAANLYLNRSDMRSERIKRWVAGVIVPIAVVAVFGYVGWRLSGVASVSDAIGLGHNPWLRTLFFSASFATQMTLSPLSSGGPWAGLVGAAGLVGITVVGYILSLRQVGWMYDTAAIRAMSVRKTTELQRSGDYSAIMAQRARDGRYRLLKLNFVKRLRLQGPWALLWKEMMLQPRTMFGMFILFTFAGVMMTGMTALIPDRAREGTGYVFLVMQGATVFMITMAFSQLGFVEVLRRVDLQKPMPFPASVTVFIEILSKSLVSVLACGLGCVVSVIIKPALWPFAAGAMIATPAFATLLSACVFFVTMLFPDVDDVSQRQFRGLMIMLSIAIGGLLPMLSVIGLLALHAHPVVACLVGGVLALAISAILAIVSGQLYANFNPTE